MDTSVKLMQTRTKQNWDFFFKLILIGDYNVGKSALITRYTDGVFKKDTLCMYVQECRRKSVTINGKKIDVDIWDTAGQEKYRSITSSYYRGADACLILFDITDTESFDNVQKWYNEIAMYGKDDMYIILVGTRSHQEDKRVVTKELAETKAVNMEMSYMECSSETGLNVNEVFEYILDALVVKHNKLSEKQEQKQNTNNTDYDTRPCWC